MNPLRYIYLYSGVCGEVFSTVTYEASFVPPISFMRRCDRCNSVHPFTKTETFSFVSQKKETETIQMITRRNIVVQNILVN